MKRVTLGVVMFLVSAGWAVAQSRDIEPNTWTDPGTGCRYLVSPVGISIRFTREGFPDCPGRRQAGVEGALPPLPGPNFAAGPDPCRELVGSINRNSDRIRDLERAIERAARDRR